MMRLMPALLWIAVLGLAHEPLGRAAADQAKAAALKNPSSPMKHERAVLAVAFSPDGKRLASGSSDARIQVLDLSAPGQAATVPVTLPSPAPKAEHKASGQDAEQPTLAVVEKISGFVGFYTDAGRRVGEAKVGKLPHEAVLAPDGRLLYVSDNGVLWMTDEGEGGNTISLIDVHAMKRIAVIDLGRFRRPHGLALHPRPAQQSQPGNGVSGASGRLLVTTEKPDALL